MLDADIMPLDLTSNQSYWLQGIYDAVGGGSSTRQVYTLLQDIKYILGTGDAHTMMYYLNQLALNTVNAANHLNAIRSQIGSGYNNSIMWYLDHMYEELYSSSGSVTSNLPAILTALQAIQGQSVDLQPLIDAVKGSAAYPLSTLYFRKWNGDGSVETFSDLTIPDILSYIVSPLNYLVSATRQSYMLSPDGVRYIDSIGYPFESLLRSIAGLGGGTFGADASTAFSFLSEDLKTTNSVTANNLLDALGIMGTQLQNPLQRLAFVFANPTDLEIRDNVSDNTDAANDNFFKPGSAGSVSVGNIKDAAGFTKGMGELIATDATPTDAIGQLNQSYDYWSQATHDDLNTLPGSPFALSSDDEEPWYFDYEVVDGVLQVYDPNFLTNYFSERR